MPPSGTPFKAANAWMKFALDYSRMSMAASEIILRRSMKMSQGAMSGPEMMGMIMEKATAFATATEHAAVAAAKGSDAATVAHAALRPYRAKTTSNVRKYRR